MDSCNRRIRLLYDRNGVGGRYGVIIRSLQTWTKSVKNFAVSYPQKAYLADWAPLWPLAPPWSKLFSLGQKLSTRNLTLFLGERGSVQVLAASAFKSLISKLDMVTLVMRLRFLIIFHWVISVSTTALMTSTQTPSLRKNSCKFLKAFTNSIGPLQLAIHVVQKKKKKRNAGEQESHWLRF